MSQASTHFEYLWLRGTFITQGYKVWQLFCVSCPFPSCLGPLLRILTDTMKEYPAPLSSSRPLFPSGSLTSTSNKRRRSPSSEIPIPNSRVWQSDFASSLSRLSSPSDAHAAGLDATTDSNRGNAGSKFDAAFENFLADFMEPNAVALIQREPIREQGTAKLGSGRVPTDVSVSLHVWEDCLGLPRTGHIIVELTEMHPNGEKKYEDGSITLNVPDPYWTNPKEYDFKRHYLDPTFDTAKELMENNLLWQKRPKTSKATLRPTIMTLCRDAYERYTKDFLARADKRSKSQN